MSPILSKEQLYSQAVQEDARSGLKILAVLAFTLFPFFSLLDYFTQYEHFGVLSLIRFSTTLIFLLMYLAFRKNIGVGKPLVASNILLAIASLSITLMCLVLTGSSSPYYAGVNLVVLAGVVIMPVSAFTMFKTVSMIIGIYVVGVFIAEATDVNIKALVSNFFFLSSTGVVGVTATHLKSKLRREVFFRNLEKAEVQNALAIRDGFISMASHELKSPITSMKLQMDIALLKLKSGELDKESVQKSISNAYRQISNISRLVDEMLDVSRIESGKFIIQKSPTELNDLLSGILLRYYSEQLSEGKIKHLACHHLLKGHWDQYKIEQVVVNLINNAVRYGEKSEVKLETTLEDDFAVIAVSDKGPGIHPDEQERIFEKFERGQSAKSGGLGLGLYICKEIVEGHSGRITLESSPDKGTTFKVYLPLN